jgi:hypothetical protein
MRPHNSIPIGYRLQAKIALGVLQIAGDALASDYRLDRFAVQLIDELAYRPLELTLRACSFSSCRAATSAGSMLVNSNRAVSECGTAFGDSVVASDSRSAAAPPRYYDPRRQLPIAGKAPVGARSTAVDRESWRN